MLAIIGGTGLYNLPGLTLDESTHITTPFGEPSGAVQRGRVHGKQILFLARHGSGHKLLPHEVNYRANIFALKQAGATQVLGFSAVGSLKFDYAPGDLVMPEQYFDWTRGKREHTFFGGGVATHVSTATPVSRALVDGFVQAAAEAGIAVHRGATYGCVEGPRLGTRAESTFLQQAGCDLVGMTNIPEVFLAREAQLAYATVGLVTDYDCWLDDPAQHVSATGIFELYGRTMEKAMRALDTFLKQPPPEPEPAIREALKTAMLTPDNALTTEQRSWVNVLKR
ncbi:MAG: S-methyl-5'-thioadenosine phosphorylase [Burkholderiaceae bacterium]